MRTKNELIDILIDEIIFNDNIGTCWAINMIWEKGKANDTECNELMNMIRINKPLKTWNDDFYFPPYEILPRIEFLNNLKTK